MADILEDCATDPSHQPAIYAAFIREIIRKTREARIKSTYPSRAGSPVPGQPGSSAGLAGVTSTSVSGIPYMSADGILPITNGTIDPNLTGATGSGSGSVGMMRNGSGGSGQENDGLNGATQQQGSQGSYDPMMGHSAWSAGAQHFQFIPQGGDMM